LFPIVAGFRRQIGGTERKTSMMVKWDLMAARDKWLDEAKKPAEKMKRLKSDFLSYCNDDGLYADFHSLRHWFITGLARAGISPKMAQTLARHSDVRLTLGLYTHVTLDDQTAAIESPPSPPAGKDGAKADGRRRGRGGRRGEKDSAA
jgi:integrase